MSAFKTVLCFLVTALAGVPQGASAGHTWERISTSDVETLYILWESVTPAGPTVRIAWFRFDPHKAGQHAYDYYLEQNVIDCVRRTYTSIAWVDYAKNSSPLKATIRLREEQKENPTRPETLGDAMVSAACGGRPR